MDMQLPQLDVASDGSWSLTIGEPGGVVWIKITAYDLAVKKHGRFDDVISWGELVDLLDEINAPAVAPGLAYAMDLAQARATERLQLVERLAGSPGVRVML